VNAASVLPTVFPRAWGRVFKLLDAWSWPGWFFFAAGLGFSISFCNYAIFVFVLLPLIIRTDLLRRSPLYRTPLDGPFLALYASMVLSSATAYLVGGAAFGNRSFLWTVTYSAPLVYYTVCYALPGKPQRLWYIMAWALFVAAAGNSAYAVVQFGRVWAAGKDLMSVRPGGRMFYMTYGGVMMVVITFAIAVLFRGGLKLRGKVALGALLAVMLAGLAVSLVRSAWVGLAAAVFVVAVVADRRLLWAFPAVVVLAAIIAPRPIIKRAESIFHAATARATGESEGPPEFRVDIWRTSLRIARAYPLTGVGLHNTVELYDKYKDAGSLETRVPHAHNNFIQMVVERGVVGLGVFIYFFYALLRLFIRGYRGARSPAARAVALAGIGATVGFLVEGFFEYTFGDYEITVIFYTMAALVVVAGRTGAPAPAE